MTADSDTAINRPLEYDEVVRRWFHKYSPYMLRNYPRNRVQYPWESEDTKLTDLLVEGK